MFSHTSFGRASAQTEVQLDRLWGGFGLAESPDMVFLCEMERESGGSLVPGLSSRCKQAWGKREWLLYQFISLSFSLCDSNEKACPGNSLSHKYSEAGEGEIHVGEGGYHLT